MNNPFPYSLDNKRYHTLNYHLQMRYHAKVAKISLNGGFNCPNIDGKVAKGGCTFCNAGSAAFKDLKVDALDVQFEKVKQIMSNKWPDCLYIAYFQANTNTYDSVEALKKRFEPFVNKDKVVGIDIATRSDCLDDDVLDYLEDLSKRTDLMVELGLQTIHDQTAKIINRGHDYANFVEGVKRLRSRNIDVCVHLINGLPNETYQMMLDSVKTVAQLDIQAIKIHLLYVTKDTAIAKLYERKLFDVMDRETYIRLVVEQLTYVPSHVVVHRLTGDGIKDELIAPEWSRKKVSILNDIDKRFVEENTFQGAKYVYNPNNR